MNEGFMESQKGFGVSENIEGYYVFCRKCCFFY